MLNSKTDDTTFIKAFKSGSIELDEHVSVDRIISYQVDRNHAIILLHYGIEEFVMARVMFMSLDKDAMFEYDCRLEHIMHLTTSIAEEYPNLRFAGCTLTGIVSLLNGLIQQQDAHYEFRHVPYLGVHLTDTHILTRCKGIDGYTAKNIITGKQQNLHISAEIFSFTPVHLLTIPSKKRRIHTSYFMS